jgi:hypothetical protein
MEWRGSCASDFFPHDRIRPIESRLVGSTDFATKLPELYEAVAKMGGAEFLNAGSVISTDGVDGLHLTAASERKLGVAVAAKVKEMALAQASQATSGQAGPPMPPGPNPNSQYRLGPDSMAQESVPKGNIRGPYTLPGRSTLARSTRNGFMCRRSTIRRFRLP